MLHKLLAGTHHVFRIKTRAKMGLSRSLWDARECQVMLRQGLVKLPRLPFKSLCKLRQSLNFQTSCFTLLGNWDYTFTTTPSSDGVLSLTGWDTLYGMCVFRGQIVGVCSLHHVGPGDQTCFTRLGPYPLSHLTSPGYFINSNSHSCRFYTCVVL